jgi:hypothetical protein
MAKNSMILIVPNNLAKKNSFKNLFKKINIYKVDLPISSFSISFEMKDLKQTT